MQIFKNLLFCLSTFLLLASCKNESSVVNADSSENENIIRNSSFEQIRTSIALQHGKESVVPDWVAYYWPDEGGIAGVADGEKKGERSVFLEVPGNVDLTRTVSWQSAQIPTEAGRKYLLEFKLRTEGLVVGKDWHRVRIFAIYLDKDNKRIRHQDLITVGSEVNKWTLFSSEFNIPPRQEISKMTICLGMSNCHGKVFFDDIKLYQKTIKKNDSDFPIPTAIIFPQPKKLEATGAKFLVKNVSVDWGNLPDGECEKFMKELLDKFLAAKKLSGKDHILSMKVEIIPDANSSRQWYRLNVSEKEIRLTGTTKAGILYGLQTLFQIMEKPESVPEVEIEDGPDFDTRGIITGAFSVNAMDLLVPYKINFYWPCGGAFACREWTRPMTEAEKTHLRGVIEGAKIRQIDIIYGMRPGWGKTELCYSSQEHMKYITDKYRTYYELGLRNFSLAFDDLFNIGRDSLSFPEDKKTFHDIGEAHYYLANEIYKFLKSLDKNNVLCVIPMYYYDPTNYSEGEKKYLRSLGKLPEDVLFINCGTLSKKGISNFEKLTNRKPFFWSNFMSQYEAVKPMPDILSPLDFKYSPDITKELKGFTFVAQPKHQMMKELFSDFMWNANNFNPAQSFYLSMRKQFGADQALLGQYIKFKEGIKSYPLAGVHKEEILYLTESTISNINSWKARLKSLPPQQKKAIDAEIDGMTKIYRVILLDLKGKEYPLKIYPAEKGFSGLKTTIGNFVLPYRSWKTDQPLRPEANTVVGTGYDKDYFYVRFVCDEPYMDKVRATQKDRDGMVFTDDCVEMFLASGKGDYFHIVVNKLGTVYDEKGSDKSWNSDVDVKVSSGKEKWTVECRIPWKTMVKTSPTAGDSWRVNFSRSRYGGKEEFSSAYLVLRGFHEPVRFWPILFSATK